MGAASVVMDHIHFTYPDGTPGLRDFSLTVAAGERVAVLGPNGAGKTTLALHLNGLLLPQTGSVSVDGVTLDATGRDAASLAEVRRRVQLLFANADDQLFMSTVRQDVAFGPANLGLRGAELDARVDAALTAVGAVPLADRAPHHLSTGEKRRAALAAVLAMEPDVLVLDEPMSGLDPAGRRELFTVLSGLAQTQLIVTHDLPFALQLCPRAIIVHEGRLAADGPTQQLLSDATLLHAHRLELPYGFSPTPNPPWDLL